MRRILLNVVALLALAACAYGANVTFWVEHRIVDERSFVAVTTEALRTEAARDALGTIVMDRVVVAEPLAALVRGPGRRLVAALLATEPARPALEDVAARVHDAVVSGDGEGVVIHLERLRAALLVPVAAIAPGLAEAVPEAVFRPVVLVEAGRLPSLGGVGAIARWAWLVLATAGILLGVALVTTTHPRALAVAGVGGALLLAGLLSLVTTRIWSGLVPGGSLAEARLAAVVGGALLEGLVRRSWVLVALGGTLLAAGVAWGATATPPR